MSERLPTELKIRYRGKLHSGQWIYQAPKNVELPIPFVSRSDKIGEVLCNPCGVFSYADGTKLLELSGENGPFVLEEKIYGEVPAEEPRREIEVGPGASEIVANPNPAPQFQPLSKEQIRKRINYGRLKRGQRVRKERSDKGISRPFGAKKASLPDNPQAVAAEVAPTQP